MHSQPPIMRVLDVIAASIVTALWGAGLVVIVWVLVIGGEL